MAFSAFLLLTGASLAFMIYVLVKFHAEARRPPRPTPAAGKNLVILKRKPNQADRRAANATDFQPSIPQRPEGETPRLATQAEVLPIGFRRLAAKRAVRR